jgi:putative protease
VLNKPGQQTYTLRPELLSPAGDWESLQAAVINGGDAVYLGTRDFNARVNAKNFSLEELGRAVSFCHNQGVRVYLTLNTLVKNSELPRFFDTLSKAYATGIDGVILQHLSFVEIIKKNYPDLAVFVSTQGALGNTASAALLKEADRIILPRELPLAEIKKMVNSGLKVEIFVHGALCFSYSGLCLFSSFISNRSGNRGCCAQLCRQKFNNRYPLSTRELCLVRRIPEFIKAGITAFKIEGRMRSPLYVAVATRLYRRAIDSFLSGEFQVPQKELEEIEVVFNREFTEGFICGDKELISPEKPMNRGALLGTMENGDYGSTTGSSR